MGAISTSPRFSNVGVELQFVQSRKNDSSLEDSQVGKRQAGRGTGRYRDSVLLNRMWPSQSAT